MKCAKKMKKKKEKSQSCISSLKQYYLSVSINTWIRNVLLILFKFRNVLFHFTVFMKKLSRGMESEQEKGKWIANEIIYINSSLLHSFWNERFICVLVIYFTIHSTDFL